MMSMPKGAAIDRGRAHGQKLAGIEGGGVSLMPAVSPITLRPAPPGCWKNDLVLNRRKYLLTV